MNNLSVIYCTISLIITLFSISIIFFKQMSLRSSAVLFFFLMEILVLLWILSDLVQVICSKPTDGPYSLPYYFAISSTITISISMVFTILFINSLGLHRSFLKIIVYIVYVFVGATIAISLSREGVFVVYDPVLEISKIRANIVWIITLAGEVFLAGTMFLIHLSRQLRLIGDEYKKGIYIMIVGVVFSYYFSLLLYALRFFKVIGKGILHSELIATSIGLTFLTVGMVIGGNKALYGSSIVISINIYDRHGLNLYQGFLSSPHYINEHLVSGVATAIAAFGSEIIGEEVFPKEIILGDYSLILVNKKGFTGFLCCKYPTNQIRQGLQNIMNHYEKKMSYKEISHLIATFLPYGLPIKIPIDLTYQQVHLKAKLTKKKNELQNELKEINVQQRKNL